MMFYCDTKQAKKLDTMVWVCNCLNPLKLYKGKYVNVSDKCRFLPTDVNEEGVCEYCGYYALSMEKSVLLSERQEIRKKEIRK